MDHEHKEECCLCRHVFKDYFVRVTNCSPDTRLAFDKIHHSIAKLVELPAIPCKHQWVCRTCYNRDKKFSTELKLPFVLQRSNHGMGGYAREFITKGSKVGEYGGRVIVSMDVETFMCNGNYELVTHNIALGRSFLQLCGKTNYSQSMINSPLYEDGYCRLGYVQFFNAPDSPQKPNVVLKSEVDTRGRDRRFAYALENIPIGDPLFAKYVIIEPNDVKESMEWVNEGAKNLGLPVLESPTNHPSYLLNLKQWRELLAKLTPSVGTRQDQLKLENSFKERKLQGELARSIHKANQRKHKANQRKKTSELIK
jgi:hypothetical protein